MRITNNTLTNSFLNNMSRNLRNMNKVQEQFYTGKAVLRPSDNPVLVGKIITMKNYINENKQYNSNISDAIGMTQTQDTSLGEAKAAMDRIRELMQSGASATISDDDRAAIKQQVDSEIDHLVDVFNTNYDGKYVFAGKSTTTRPFSKDENGKIVNNIEGKDNLKVDIASGVTVEMVNNGDRLISVKDKDGNISDLGDVLSKISNALGSGDQEEIDKLSDEYMGEFDKHLNNVLSARTEIGTIDNRLTAAKDRNEAENLNLKEVLSSKEDVDIVEKYMESQMLATIYQASLSAGAKVLQPSLMDYLR